MHDFLYDQGVLHNYFNESESNRLKTNLKPWKKKLRAFTNPRLHLNKKRKLLFSKQRGSGEGKRKLVASWPNDF